LNYTVAPGIFLLPVLTDGFCRFVQPITVSEQADQFSGTEEFHGVWSENGSVLDTDIFRFRRPLLKRGIVAIIKNRPVHGY
jgi:hypothetical protein